MGRRGEIRTQVVQLLLLAVIAFGVVWTSHENAKDLAAAQRSGCKRGKLDRAANARAWRNAERVRRDQRDVRVANDYAAVAGELEARSRIDCRAEFPSPGWLP